MKKIAMTSIVFLSTNSFAFLTPMPMPVPPPTPALNEAVLVKEVVQSANLMPGPGPARPIDTRLEVNVMSSGCTTSSDFDVKVMSTGKEQILNIVRVNQDECDDAPTQISVTIDTTKIGLSSYLPIRIANPILAVEHVSH